MTDKEAMQKMRTIGMVLTKADGEYRVNFKGGEEATAYYTNDRNDAVVTGTIMAVERAMPDKFNFRCPVVGCGTTQVTCDDGEDPVCDICGFVFTGFGPHYG